MRAMPMQVQAQLPTIPSQAKLRAQEYDRKAEADHRAMMAWFTDPVRIARFNAINEAAARAERMAPAVVASEMAPAVQPSLFAPAS